MSTMSSTGTHASADSRSAENRSGGSTARRDGAAISLCTFLLGARSFGLDVGLVGEVVVVEGLTPIPLGRAGLSGLFNLRGTPVALVDTIQVLGLRDLRESQGLPGVEPRERGRSISALVLRHADLVVALEIDRVEAVVEASRGQLTDATSPEEHPVVRGFLQIDGRVVTVLEADTLLAKLDELRYARSAET
jgi:purine-binding chemotaxis protein CheW